MADPIGVPLFYDLGESAAPGAQSVDVPADATLVAIFIAQSDDYYTANADLTAMAADFTGAWLVEHKVATAVGVAGAAAWAAVTSTGAGKTWTPTFTATNTVARAIGCVMFFKNAGAVLAAVAQATGAGQTAATGSAAGVNGGTSIAFDARLDAAAGNFPANEVGWTSQGTGQVGPGSQFGYYLTARLRTKAITANGTETATTQTTNGSVIALLTTEPVAVPLPTIDTDPTKQVVAVGSDATFTGAAHSNGGTGLTLTWQIDTGSGWTDLPGATFPVTIGMDGAAVSFLATDSAGSTRSASALLDVYDALFDPVLFDPVLFDTTQIGGGTVNAAAAGADTTAGQATPTVAVGAGATGADVTGGTAGAGVTVAGGASGADQTGGSATGGVGQVTNAAASGADTTAGSAQAKAGISVSAVGVSTSGGSAGPTVAVSTSAVGVDVTGGAANRQVTVTVSALGLAQAAGQAGVSARVMAAAAGAAQAAGNATLAAQIAAIASGTDQTGGSANGSVTGASQLPGSASGADTTSGSAVMTVSIQLQATGTDVTGGSATAGTGRAAAAQGADQTAGSATLSINVAVTAAGFAQAAGVGYFEVSVPASAFGAGQTAGSASAAILNLNIDGPIWMTATVRRLARFAAMPGRATTLKAAQGRIATFRSEVQRVH
jgi:hypothetical protein